MSLRIFVSTVLFFTSVIAQAKVTPFFHPFFNGLLNGKVFVVEPDDQPVIADIIFLTGYYDRPDNHLQQMEARAKQGFRVISFAYPSHDENYGPYNFLSLHNFSSLFQMIKEVELATRIDQIRPMALEGWSLGGELIVRFIQSEEYLKMGRNIFALALQAPSVAVLPVVGEYGLATRRTLTRNQSHPFGGPLSPKSPMFHLPFTLSLVGNCIASFCSTLPSEIPALVQTAGNDKYVWTDGVHLWVNRQRKAGADIQLNHYVNAMHMLSADSPSVVSDAGDFLANTVRVIY